MTVEFYVGVSTKNHIENVENRFMWSFRQARKRKSKIAIDSRLKWIMDSGAFQEIRLHGRYTYTPEEYMVAIERYNPDIFVSMDFMCEPFQLNKSGKTIREHQMMSIDNHLRLIELKEKNNISSKLMGVLQGWEIDDYMVHIDMMREYGLIGDLVGVGSICRRGSRNQIISILKAIKKELPDTDLHGFGVKTSILRVKDVYSENLVSSCDSMAWCYEGRKMGEYAVGIGGCLYGMDCIPFPDKKCFRETDDCANCERYMIYWNRKIEAIIKTRGDISFERLKLNQDKRRYRYVWRAIKQENGSYISTKVKEEVKS